MIKKIAAISTLTLTMTGCVYPQNTDLYKVNTSVYVSKSEVKTFSIHEIILQANSTKMQKALKSLNKYVGKTWYVFSGNTPSGWDCSGLTMWFYEQLGIQLEHRASKQDDAGIKTKNPKPGDIVVFKYKGYNDAYHVGIYIGNGEMIHAPKHGHLTRIENISTFAGKYSKIEYRRILQTSNL